MKQSPRIYFCSPRIFLFYFNKIAPEAIIQNESLYNISFLLSSLSPPSTSLLPFPSFFFKIRTISSMNEIMRNPNTGDYNKDFQLETK